MPRGGSQDHMNGKITVRKSGKPLDPNAKKTVKASCKYCYEDDTLEMVACDKCEEWVHFSCDEDSIVDIGPWICRECFDDLQIPVDEAEPSVINKTNTCLVCSSNIDDNAMTCDTCGKAIHDACVEDKDRCSTAEGKWRCRVCRRVNPLKRQNCLAKSTDAHSTSSSTQSKTQLDLDRLKEERLLAKKMIEIEQDYLREKRGRSNLLLEIEREYIQQKYDILRKAQSNVHSDISDNGSSKYNRIRSWAAETAQHNSKLNSNFGMIQSNATTSRNTTTRNVDHNTAIESGAIPKVRNANSVRINTNPTMHQPATLPVTNNNVIKLPNLHPHRSILQRARHRLNISSVESSSDEEDQRYRVHNDVQRNRHSNHTNQSTCRGREFPIQRHIIHQHSDNNYVENSMLTQAQISARHASSTRCDLIVFSGDPLEFPTFISNFNNTTLRCGYTNEENLIRLQKCLKGTAARDVRSMLLTPDTVPQAIECLTMKYGRPEIILNLLLQEVQSASAVKMDKLQTIIELNLMIQNIVATMKASEMRAHLTNPMLLQELISKLPSALQLQWISHQKQFDTVDLSTFASWLDDLAKDAAKITTPLMNAEKAKTQFNSKNRNRNVHLQGSHTFKNNNSSSEDTCCDNCGDAHHIRRCQKFSELSRKERWSVVVTKKLCRGCLGRHFTLKCRRRSRCNIDSCAAKHHPLLHGKEFNKSDKNDTSEKGVTLKVDMNNSTCMAQRKSCSKSIFRIVPVILYGNNIEIETFAYLDDGSGVTLIEEQLADCLKLQGNRSKLCLKWSGGITREEPNSRTVNLRISSTVPGSKKFVLQQVKTVECLDLTMQTLDIRELEEKYKHLSDIPIKSYKNASPGILIGLNNWNVATPLETREGRWGEPIANRTRLGWVICGSYLSSDQGTRHSLQVHHCGCSPDGNLHELVKEFFSLENVGVKYPQQTLESKQDTRAREILSSTTTFNGSKYVTGLLWKEENIQLPNNRAMAERRLSCLTRKMKRNPELATKLREMIEQYVMKGYARRMLQDEIDQAHDRVWYLPVFVIQQTNKPSKLRLVWDAAAEYKGISLNSKLLKGPDQNTPLLTILFQFRENKIAISGDIAEMFHQVQVLETDQQSQRFLFPNETLEGNPETFIMKVLTFGSTSSPASAQFVKNANADRFALLYPTASEAIKHKHYVDDYLQSFDDLREAKRVVKDVIHVHGCGGFTIRNWRSNSSQLLQALNTTNCETTKGFDLIESSIEKVLGMKWNTLNDTFIYEINVQRIGKDIWEGTREPTKREVLKTLMMIFDPMGLLNVLMVPLKILMHKIWRTALTWDDSISDDLYENWLQWVKLMSHLHEIRIPRHYGILTQHHNNIEIHILVDAGEIAYAALAYIRFGDAPNICCRLIGSKCRTAPQKPLSIPRMELLAAVLGARFLKLIMETHSFNIKSTFLWTDSRTVIRWLNSDARKYKQFVALRVGELLETTNVKDWRWIPSADNAADEATKLKGENKFSETIAKWFDGPAFLRQPESEWPRDTENGDEIFDETETKVQNTHYEITYITSPVTPEPHRFSSWRRLIGTQAYLNRAIQHFKIPKNLRRIDPIDSDEYRQAEYNLYRRAQWDEFFEDMQKLSSPNQQVEKQSQLFQLSPYLDELGVLRMKGRIDLSEHASDDTKRPIILPHQHYITHLIVFHYHKRYLHRNHETVINELRQKFVISRLRQLLANVRKMCQHCKNLKATPIPPEMGDLPKSRLSAYTRPFTHTGTDCFGPIEVQVGRRSQKRWGMLFT